MTLHELFKSVGEPFAAGLFEYEGREPILRYSNAYRRFWEEAVLPVYNGGRLYPCGKRSAILSAEAGMAVVTEYSYTYGFNREAMRAKTQEGYAAMKAENEKVRYLITEHAVGGNGYTHCFANYKRLLAEGLKGYRVRVEAECTGDFREGLLILLDGIEIYRQRCLNLLREASAPAELIAALEYVPENPPRNIYEALVAWNFLYYIDGCDDIGALDRNLLPYYNGEDIVPLLRELFTNVDANDGWSGPLGPDYNAITCQCIRAIQGIRRPNLQLLVKPDMPDEVWQEVYASLATSCGQPSLYNYDLYMKNLRELLPEIPESDWERLAFGGCTETMLEGISAVGSDDAGINAALVFDRYLRNALPYCASFERFLEGLYDELRRIVNQTLELVNVIRRDRAKHLSQPVHTLFVDDCISRSLDFNNDGARWYWSVVNVAGLINVIESLSVVRELVYEQKLYTGREFLEKLDAQDPAFLRLAKKCPHYGVDDDRADALGIDLANHLYDAFDDVPCYPRGRFFPVSNQFVTYTGAGIPVRATPDGRCDGAPLCDSVGAIHGFDTEGPTALLGSVAKMPFNRVIGTPIFNLRMRKEHLEGQLKPLITAFFEKGGMQAQISCLSREDMLDAMEHPERHQNLIVRIGGYSEYFVRLDRALQETVLKRTEY